jgi:hypothetical protein
MVKKPGPWQLNVVKKRLRAEQIERENAASAWYRDKERRDNTIQNNTGIQVGLIASFF